MSTDLKKADSSSALMPEKKFSNHNKQEYVRLKMLVEINFLFVIILF